LDSEELKAVLASARHRRYLAHSVVTNEGHPAEHLYLLLNGRGRYFTIAPHGQKVLLFWIPPGEVIGAAAILRRPSPYAASAEVVRNSNVLVWSRATIRSLAARYPVILENALLIAFDYLVDCRALHISRTYQNARQRLAAVLVNLADGIGEKGPDGIVIDINNEELANEANVTMFTASRLLSGWQRNGMVVKKRGRVLLPSPERLLAYEHSLKSKLTF
jgi:CRP-like cAMP-binding protein